MVNVGAVVLVAGALLAGVVTALPAGAAPPKLEEELALADGRRVELSSPDGKRFFSRSYDPETKKWTAADLVHTARGACGDIMLAANRSTVAATLRCSAKTPEAGAAVGADDSRALVTTDHDAWKLQPAPGLGAPQVSPNGRRAVWPGSTRVLTWWRDHRFSDEPADAMPDGTVRLAIGDDGVLTALLNPKPAGCRVDLWVRPVATPSADGTPPARPVFRRSYRSEPYPSEDADVAEGQEFSDCALAGFDLGENGVLKVKLRNRKTVHAFEMGADGDWAPAPATQVLPPPPS